MFLDELLEISHKWNWLRQFKQVRMVWFKVVKSGGGPCLFTPSSPVIWCKHTDHLTHWTLSVSAAVSNHPFRFLIVFMMRDWLYLLLTFCAKCWGFLPKLLKSFLKLLSIKLESYDLFVRVEVNFITLGWDSWNSVENQLAAVWTHIILAGSTQVK